MHDGAARSAIPTALRAALGLATALLSVALLHASPAEAREDARTVTVTMGDFFYAPKVARVRAGQTVRFVNRGKIDHTIADVNARGAILGRAIKPRLLSTGDAQRVVFRAPGTIRYVCTLHPTRMGGTVIVTR